MRTGDGLFSLLTGFVLTAAAAADGTNVPCISNNGRLLWQNGDSNLYYTVEWLPASAEFTHHRNASTKGRGVDPAAPLGRAAWSNAFDSLQRLRSTNATVSVAVPAFYRVIGRSRRAERALPARLYPTAYPAPVPRTGQVATYAEGDDGYYRMGVPWPTNRFIVHGSTNEQDTVTDDLTGLMWSRLMNHGGRPWGEAVDYCSNLTWHGYDDWRLPNARELYSLVDFSAYYPALPEGHPFEEPESRYVYHWSSTTCTSPASPQGSDAWFVGFDPGWTWYDGKNNGNAVWPVRGRPKRQVLIATEFRDGRLAWENIDTNVDYSVLWAPRLAAMPLSNPCITAHQDFVEWPSGSASDPGWRDSYAELQDIQSTQAWTCVAVPAFFRVRAHTNSYPAILPRTGQTNSWHLEDDGELRVGVEWPSNRFTVCAAGEPGPEGDTVLDELTGLMWTRNSVHGPWTWTNALAYCNGLESGGYSDWRLPNVRELGSLIDFSAYGPALPEDHPFTNEVSGAYYWTSTTYTSDYSRAWYVYVGGSGLTWYRPKDRAYHVWPVRSGVCASPRDRARMDGD